MQTGYFTNVKHSTKVHIIDENGEPVCGSHIGADMEYQWCSGTLQISYVDCNKCRAVFIKLEEARINELKNQKIKHFDM